MYVSTGTRSVLAIEAGTGTVKWRYRPESRGPNGGNKGVVVAEGKVFFGRRDNVLVALDQEAGCAQPELDQAASAQDPIRVTGVPQFEVDPTWPKLPNNWVLGTSINVAVDRRDHVWIIHRFRFVPDEHKERAAPPVLEFDENGDFVQAWGGPSDAYEFEVDPRGRSYQTTGSWARRSTLLSIAGIMSG